MGASFARDPAATRPPAGVCDYLALKALVAAATKCENPNAPRDRRPVWGGGEVGEMPKEDVTKVVLTESEIPTAWYNILPDLPGPPAPPLHPGTMQPAGPQDLAPLFPEALIKQEVSTERWIDIPGPVLDVYRLWRPTPLHRARRLESALGLGGKQRIYYKWEGTSPAGSHKPNTAVAQAYFNKEAGIRRLTTETGAGQWGSALAMACAMFELDCLVFMVKVSYEQKPYRRVLMQTWGATVHPSPSQETKMMPRMIRTGQSSVPSSCPSK
jgi:tryptophan synthase beta chain